MSKVCRTNCIPVGILTRNRPALLDLTLRSLSASTLPREIYLTVYDDMSNLPEAVKYLYSSELRGIQGRIKVTRSESWLGVLHGSVWALKDLARIYETPYVCLLQDDIVFVKNWYNIMYETAMLYHPGILAGVGFGNVMCQSLQKGSYAAVRTRVATYTIAKVDFVQAQCLFVSRDILKYLFVAASSISKSQRKEFDTFLCKTAVKNGFDVLMIYPHVCQHLGIKSLVRPNRRFDRKGGRYSRCILEPIVLTQEVLNYNETR